MSLTIHSRIIADAQIQAVTIRPVVGAYELLFALYVTIHPDQEEPFRRASIAGARVSLKTRASGTHDLGFARPEKPFDIITHRSPSSTTPVLVLPIQPGQVAAIETLRGSNDLDFELNVAGTGMHEGILHQVYDTWRTHVSRSDWIKKLRDAKARNTMLIEVPLPLPGHTTEMSSITNELIRAEEQFTGGDYHACIGTCRTVLQELGHHFFKTNDWSGALLDRLGSNRNKMTKGEREATLWAALRHFTHQAHHGASEGGVPHYSRAEAQLVLTLTASVVSNALAANNDEIAFARTE